MAFQIRDLVSDVWLEEGEEYQRFAGCIHPSCDKSSDDGDGDGDGDDDKGGHGGGHKSPKGDEKGSKPKYAPEAGLALLRQQLEQSLALGL
jgi:hypothetical protein